MKKIYITFLLFVVAVMSGCYEDKGNYDYKNINELEITFEKPTYSVTFGESLSITPDFNLELPEESDRYTYNWYVNGNTRPEWNQRDFNWAVDTIFKDGKVVLEVTDTKYGITYMNRASLDVVGIFENNYSWMILSDVEGESRLSYFSNLEYDSDAEEFKKVKFYDDVYVMANDGKLGTGPIALQEHFRAQVDYETIIGNVCVFQESGAVDLSGESFEKQIDMVESFDGGVYPAGAIIYPGTFMDRVDVLADQKGQLYSRFRAVATVYNSEYFLQTPLSFEGETLEQCRVARGFYRANRTGYAVVYDGKNKRMLYTVNSDYWDNIAGAGRFVALPARGIENTEEDVIVPLDNMEGYELIKMGMFGYGSLEDWTNQYGIYLLLREESTDKVFLELIRLKGSSARPVLQEVLLHEIKGLPEVPSTVTVPLDKPEYAFFGAGNNVYFLDLKNPKNSVVLYKSFGAKVTAINAESMYNKHMAVGLENGEFYILFIREAKNVAEEKKVLYPKGAYPADQRVGRIVDIQYKQLDHWNY